MHKADRMRPFTSPISSDRDGTEPARRFRLASSTGAHESRVMPEIRFLRLPEGPRIAYSVHGSGPPLVCPASWVSHVERDWHEPRFRAFFEALGAFRTVVRWDRWGSGMSDRDRTTFELSDEVSILAAMVDHLELETFELFGFSCGGPPAIAYAAEHPERVSRLLLFGAYVDGSSAAPIELQRAVAQLVRSHWGLGAKTLTDLFAPDLLPNEAQQATREQLTTATPDMAANLFEFAYRMNVRDLAPRVQAPALVLHRRGDRTISLDAARDLAASLPHATFTVLEGNEHTAWLGALPPLMAATEQFLRPPAPTAGAREPDSFRRAGFVWRVVFESIVSHVPHTKGMSDLAALLARSGEDVLALELQQGQGHAVEETVTDLVLDEQALRELRARVLELEASIDEAEANADLGRTQRLRHEREAVAHELAAATGLGGRRRRFVDPAERARKTVTARIRQALQQIAQSDPALADHLEASLSTGRSCAYRPAEPRPWLL
jgi:pimeloyl-ACP methyl ester carboxylesterase